MVFLITKEPRYSLLRKLDISLPSDLKTFIRFKQFFGHVRRECRLLKHVFFLSFALKHMFLNSRCLYHPAPQVLI